MSSPIDGGPAFPGEELRTESQGYQSVRVKRPTSGMTLRDYFAGQALVGLVELCRDEEDEPTLSDTAETCYRYADAMLEARDA